MSNQRVLLKILIFCQVIVRARSKTTFYFDLLLYPCILLTAVNIRFPVTGSGLILQRNSEVFVSEPLKPGTIVNISSSSWLNLSAEQERYNVVKH